MSAPLAAGIVGPGALELAAACAPVLAAGLVAVAGGAAPGDGPAGRRARRLARSLAGQGLAATAAGPVAWLLAEEAGDALLAARLAQTPVVLAAPGPRDAAAEELLACCGVILVVAAAADEVAEFALEDLASAALPAARVTPPGALERAALRVGLPPAPARRRELREVLGR